MACARDCSMHFSAKLSSNWRNSFFVSLLSVALSSLVSLSTAVNVFAGSSLLKEAPLLGT